MTKPTEKDQTPAVVLVHGIWMNGVLMGFLAKQLKRRGFDAHTISYRSIKKSPAQNARKLHELIKNLPNTTVHLVGHSLGGIVILHLLDQYDNVPNGRDGVLGGAPVYQNGPDARELGIIRGTVRLGAAALVRKPGETNDGVVSESETMINGANDYVDLPLSHSMLIFSRRSAELVTQFLNNGRFSS